MKKSRTCGETTNSMGIAARSGSSREQQPGQTQHEVESQQGSGVTDRLRWNCSRRDELNRVAAGSSRWDWKSLREHSS
uniref:Uncharacterized protein n=1 Tax=Physcomitrium patens TaxID=3218 RepID=A0A2K1K4K4_PHYPA|nr:hypothetical protein PHYPA_013177 [Physcomitrium patens]